jgi:hypothetical protein
MKAPLPGRKLKHRETRYRCFQLCLLLMAACVLPAKVASGAGLLMTLGVSDSHVAQNENFVLNLEVYAPPGEDLSEILIDGLTQFRLVGQNKSLVEVPSGKTVKWVLQYKLVGPQDGIFKLGPAVSIFDGRRYSSNTLFITVEKSGIPPAQEKPPPPPSEPQITSPEQIGNKIQLFMEPSKTKIYRTEGVPVTIRLLTQLPVESLRFRDDPDFPGFLKYDFPFTEKPKADKVTYHGAEYVTYQLEQFLIFPLQDGSAKIPSVTCELDVLVPAGTFGLGNNKMQIVRTTAPVELQVASVPPGALVGSFAMRNELIQDGSRSKIVRLIVEGEGLLSLFDFPSIAGSDYQADAVGSSATASLQGRKLLSKRTADFEITPTDNTTNIALRTIRVRQLDPVSGHLSTLTLPPIRLSFSPLSPSAKKTPAVPDTLDRLPLLLWMLLLASVLLSGSVLFRPRRKAGPPKLSSLLHRKKLELQVSKSSALQLYQQIVNRLPASNSAASLLVTLSQHLSPEEWKSTEKTFRTLEWVAFSPVKTASLTYQEMKEACVRVEKGWVP